MSARMSIFKVDLAYDNKSPNNLTSICLKSSHNSIWKQQNVDYKINGFKTKERNFDDCYSNVKKLLENRLNAPVELRKKQIYAFSFYYDRMLSANLIGEDGGLVKIEKILEQAKTGIKNCLFSSHHTNFHLFFCLNYLSMQRYQLKKL